MKWHDMSCPSLYAEPLPRTPPRFFKYTPFLGRDKLDAPRDRRLSLFGKTPADLAWRLQHCYGIPSTAGLSGPNLKLECPKQWLFPQDRSERAWPRDLFWPSRLRVIVRTWR